MSQFASAEIVGEYPNQKLNLVIPRGVKGDKGDTGEQGPVGPVSTVPGPQGIQGVQGDPGDMTVVAGPANVSGTVNIVESMLPSTRVWTLTSNLLLTLATPTTPKSGTITLVIYQDATGGRSVTWPSATLLKWPEGIQQQPSTAPNSMSIFHLMWTGNQWVALLGGKSFA